MCSSSAAQERQRPCRTLERRAEPISGLYRGVGPLRFCQGTAKERYVLPDLNGGTEEEEEERERIFDRKIMAHT